MVVVNLVRFVWENNAEIIEQKNIKTTYLKHHI